MLKAQHFKSCTGDNNLPPVLVLFGAFVCLFGVFICLFGVLAVTSTFQNGYTRNEVYKEVYLSKTLHEVTADFSLLCASLPSSGHELES